MQVIVDNYLRLDPAQLPDTVLAFLMNALTAVNPDDTDEKIVMWSKDHQGLMTMNRGFAHKLVKGLAHFGISVEWDDRRVSVPMTDEFIINDSIGPRAYQDKASNLMAEIDQGIYEGPPAAGKTIATIKYIAKARQKTIIMVNRTNLASQWRERIYDATGYTAGLIGDDNWFERDVTVAVIQSLYAKRDELDRIGWWKNWGAEVMDECHAVGASSTRQIINRFPAKDRIGLSATPDRHDWLEIVSRSTIGEIFCRTTDEELEREGVLVRPQIIAVRTDLTFPWEPKTKKGKPNPKYNPRKQFAALLKELKFDKGRNMIFAQLLSKMHGHTILIHTDHKGQAHELAGYALASGWRSDQVLMLTGDQNEEARGKVIKRMAEGDCVCFSTIGQEGLDIPTLDRFFLVFPSKSAPMVKQMTGRVKRAHETKVKPPIVIDLYDHYVEPLANHFNDRRGEYDRGKMPLKIVTLEQALVLLSD